MCHVSRSVFFIPFEWLVFSQWGRWGSGGVRGLPSPGCVSQRPLLKNYTLVTDLSWGETLQIMLLGICATRKNDPENISSAEDKGMRMCRGQNHFRYGWHQFCCVFLYVCVQPWRSVWHQRFEFRGDWVNQDKREFFFLRDSPFAGSSAQVCWPFIGGGAAVIRLCLLNLGLSSTQNEK